MTFPTASSICTSPTATQTRSRTRPSPCCELSERSASCGQDCLHPLPPRPEPLGSPDRTGADRRGLPGEGCDRDDAEPPQPVCPREQDLRALLALQHAEERHNGGCVLQTCP